MSLVLPVTTPGLGPGLPLLEQGLVNQVERVEAGSGPQGENRVAGILEADWASVALQDYSTCA